jgi:K+-sensing histidine kinase KdpD
MSTEEISFTDLMALSIHDMKNSMNVQVHALETQAQNAKLRGDQEAFNSLVGLVAQAQRMNVNLIELLSLYKFGKSSYPLDINEQSVAELLAETLLQTRAMLDFRNIQVEVDCPSDCFWYFDRDLMTGVLLNALNNAFSHSRGRIRLAARVQNSMLVLRVEDDGAGYPVQLLNSEAVAAQKKVDFSSGSTGLGFCFSAQVAQLHRNQGRCGSLSLENGGAYGGGCFVLQLP